MAYFYITLPVRIKTHSALISLGITNLINLEPEFILLVCFWVLHLSSFISFIPTVSWGWWYVKPIFFRARFTHEVIQTFANTIYNYINADVPVRVMYKGPGCAILYCQFLWFSECNYRSFDFTLTYIPDLSLYILDRSC